MAGTWAKRVLLASENPGYRRPGRIRQQYPVLLMDPGPSERPGPHHHEHQSHMESKPPDEAELKATAYHEAGHAVAAIALKRDFGKVSIEPSESEGDLGHVLTPKPPMSFWPGMPCRPEDKELIEADILVRLAGMPAEAIFTGRENHRGAEGDLKNARDLASKLYPCEVLETYIAFMSARARHLVREPTSRIQIKALANALIKKKNLSGAEARTICMEASQAATRRAAESER